MIGQGDGEEVVWGRFWKQWTTSSDSAPQEIPLNICRLAISHCEISRDTFNLTSAYQPYAFWVIANKTAAGFLFCFGPRAYRFAMQTCVTMNLFMRSSVLVGCKKIMIPKICHLCWQMPKLGQRLWVGIMHQYGLKKKQVRWSKMVIRFGVSGIEICRNRQSHTRSFLTVDQCNHFTVALFRYQAAEIKNTCFVPKTWSKKHENRNKTFKGSATPERATFQRSSFERTIFSDCTFERLTIGTIHHLSECHFSDYQIQRLPISTQPIWASIPWLPGTGWAKAIIANSRGGSGGGATGPWLPKGQNSNIFQWSFYEFGSF